MITKSGIQIEFPMFESAKVEALNNLEVVAWTFDLMAKLLRAEQAVIANVQPPKQWQVMDKKPQQTKIPEQPTETPKPVEHADLESRTPKITEQPKQNKAPAPDESAESVGWRMANECWDTLCEHKLTYYRDMTFDGTAVLRFRDKVTGETIATISVDPANKTFTYVKDIDLQEYTDPLKWEDYRRAYTVMSDELIGRLITAGIIPANY